MQAFNKLKKRLVLASLLAYFNPERPLILETDTLDSVIAGVFFSEATRQRMVPYYILFKDYNRC